MRIGSGLQVNQENSVHQPVVDLPDNSRTITELGPTGSHERVTATGSLPNYGGV